MLKTETAGEPGHAAILPLSLRFIGSVLHFFAATFNVFTHALEGVAGGQAGGEDQYTYYSHQFFHDIFPSWLNFKKVCLLFLPELIDKNMKRIPAIFFIDLISLRKFQCF
jgi:hypothetical protein